MLYTVGQRDGYHQTYMKRKLEGKELYKEGKTDKHNGGTIWETEEEAQKYLNDHPNLPYIVFGVDTDMSNVYNDEKSPTGLSLVENAPIIILDHKKFMEDMIKNPNIIITYKVN